MKTKKPVSIEFNPAEFVLIARNEILAVNALPADIFLKISENKVIKIGRRGAPSLDDLHVLENEAICDFYVHKSEYKGFVGQNLMIVKAAIEMKELPDQKKIEFLSLTTQSVFNEIESIGFNHESLEHAKMVSKSINALVATKQDIHSVMTLLAEISDDLLRHAVAVSAVSVMIGKAMGWTVPATLEKLALGGLLHDIGMKELPKEILEKPRHQLTFEERQAYETHVFRGAEILSTMPNVPEDVIAIVLEHHENSIGQGYPRRLREFKMNPLARVVALSDCFCELTLKNVDHPQPKSAVDAISYIETALGQPFAKSAFNGLKEALNYGLQKNGKIKIVA